MKRILIALTSFSITIAVAWMSNAANHDASPTQSPAAASLPTALVANAFVVANGAPRTNPPAPTPTPTPTPLIPETIVPVASPTSTTLPTATGPSEEHTPLAIVSLTSPVPQKSDAHIVVRTVQKAACTIEVTLPSGTVSTSKDLAPKNANEDGIVEWTWGINWNTKPGTAKIKLSCSVAGTLSSGEAEMTIIASQ